MKQVMAGTWDLIRCGRLRVDYATLICVRNGITKVALIAILDPLPATILQCGHFRTIFGGNFS